jgi:hypothetical protein
LKEGAVSIGDEVVDAALKPLNGHVTKIMLASRPS